jgi:hypothetical protein
MRLRLHFLLGILSAISACNKGSNGQSQTNPTAPDTVYLRKTLVTYEYNPAGSNTIQDSTLGQWAYDAQKRMISYIYHDAGGQIDTNLYTYNTGQNGYYFALFSGSTLLERGTETDYLNSLNLIDSSVISVVSNIINNGVQTPETSTSIINYFYDGSGNDTLQAAYSVNNNVKTLSSTSHKTYANGALSSVVNLTANGLRTGGSVYAGGNIITDTAYLNGTLQVVENFSYTSILSGGFYGPNGNKNLMATYAQISPIPAESLSDAYTYTFDKSNRVSTVTLQNSSGQTTEKDIYTYY